MRSPKTFLALLVILVGMSTATLSCQRIDGDSSLDDILEVGVEAPNTVKVGGDVYLGLFVRNISDEGIGINFKETSFDLIVTDSDGNEVWRWWANEPSRGYDIHRGLGPGDEADLADVARFAPQRLILGGNKAVWEQIDNKGKRVPPGTYFVKGQFTGSLGAEGSSDEVTIQSAAHKLVVRPLGEAELANDSFSLKLDLDVPETVKSGEPVLLGLTLTNGTDKPITITSGDADMDFLIANRKGQLVWQWWRFMCCEDYGVTITLQPGETLDVREYLERLPPSRSFLLQEISDNKVIWKQTDNLNNVANYGDRVPAGTYFVRGGVSRSLIGEPITGLSIPDSYRTPWKKLVIQQ